MLETSPSSPPDTCSAETAAKSSRCARYTATLATPFSTESARSTGIAASATRRRRSGGADAREGKNTARHCANRGRALGSTHRYCASSFATTTVASELGFALCPIPLPFTKPPLPRRSTSLASASAAAVPGHPSSSASATAAPPVTSTPFASMLNCAFSSSAAKSSVTGSSITKQSASVMGQFSNEGAFPASSSESSASSASVRSTASFVALTCLSSSCAPYSSARSPRAFAAMHRTAGASAASAVRNTRTVSPSSLATPRTTPNKPSVFTASFRTEADTCVTPGLTKVCMMPSPVSKLTAARWTFSRRSAHRKSACAVDASSPELRSASAAATTTATTSVGSDTARSVCTKHRSHAPVPPRA
mmetsp:Transcript_73/g.229  ORF Transcript_73/g.229 Transcript_73/m.229 type:complete len:363 (+) Transcript_73:806-1894(+)